MTMLPHPARTLCLGLVLLACQQQPVLEPETSGVNAAELPGSCYGIAVTDAASNDLLLGNLCFDSLQGEALTGSWNLEAWGEQALFAGLPVNEAEAFPATAAMETFEAEVFGDMVLMALPLPDQTSHLGLVLESQEGERLYGTASLLPDRTFEGRVDGVRRRD